VTREQLVATLREELGSLKHEINSLRAGEDAADGETNSSGGAMGGKAPTASKESSLAYWRRLNEIALGEAALQNDAERAFDEANASKVFAIKARIGRFAAKAVEAIPSEHVDASLVQFGRQLGVWYEHGSELYERATQIWESATNSQGREQLNADWKRAELHHKNEASLLRDKANAVRSAASRRFAFEFSGFAEATPAGPAE
jgi:hypothetical protein